MSATSSIVLLRPDDARDTAALHAACFSDHGRWSVKAMRETLTLPSTLALGAETGDGLSGLIIVQRAPPDAEILTIGVHPAKRRTGLAQEMLNHALTLLGPYGVDRLLLEVAADNKAGIAFYQRNRFQRDGVRKNYYRREGQQSCDAVLMSRKLAGQTGKSKA